MTQLDLFTAATPTCGSCSHLGAAIDSGVRYCTRWAVWRWSAERIDCPTWSA